MASLTLTVFVLATLLPYLNTEYIPPGPAYPCPKKTDNQLLFPCVCEKGTDAGLYVRCENTGLAVMSVGIGNIAGMGLPIERLLLKECKISHLFGPLLHRSTVRTLHIIDTPIKSIDEYAFAGVNRTLQEIYLYNTRINEFPKEAFKILGNLTILSIDGHRMTSLSKDIFGGSLATGRLEKLHLVNGLLTDIPPEAFQNLKKLKTLDLHGNRLATLKRNQFKGLRDTEVLDLSYNNITKLDGSHIGDLTKLGWCNASHNLLPDIPRRLYLQDNEISDVGRGTFTAVTRIGTVDLARNKITKVDYQMFQAVKYAEIINLAENKITSIDKQAFTDLYLASVNISHNEISSIESGAFQNCNNMTLLDLSHNKLKEINKNAFDENTYAGEFQVSYNEFTDLGQIPIQNMTGIRVLNASHNSITTIPKTAFPKLYELHTVDVSHNNVSDIFNAVFQNLFSLRFLNLSHNSLERIKPSTFGTIHTILELDLSHNQLVDVSRGSLAKLASCRLLDISYNYLDRIFQIPISLGELNIAHNNLSEIKAGTWPVMNALLRLNLSTNVLEDRLTSDAFAGLLTLQSLDLSSNGLTKPPWEALNTMTSLQYLYLQHNKLTSLSRSAFGNLPTTFKLDLSYNQLTELGQKTFNGMQQLLDLSLRGNKLEHLQNEVFKGLVALRKLDLSYNSLDKIDNKTNGLLDDCLSLEMVNLSHNRFGFLSRKMFPANPWIPYRLMEVDLSYNEIPVVTFDITFGTKHLKKLNLSNNYINDIRNNVLGNLTSLEVLDVSNNQLKDLVSRTSDTKFNLPENITEIYLQNNTLEKLPTENLGKSNHLKVLDLRNNLLTSFYPELVKKIRDNNLMVYFENNKLKCDCFTRPLKHYLQKLPDSFLKNDDKYKSLACFEPPSLEDANFLELDEERLLCASNIELDDKIREYGNTEFDFTSEPDVLFRDIQYSQTSIYAFWYVPSTKDVADFYIYVRDSSNKLFFSQDVAYNLRSLSINVDKDFATNLQKGGKIEICIQAKSSSNFARKFFDSQCQIVPSNYDSWSDKLTAAKRKLSRKRVKYIHHSRSSVLGLVSDSILITLCIFLGVCFRRLADLDV
ncbi:chaoptin isoform X2 [Pararge aegeria]|uniref:chaoptin isoform X2 n=1 Tax=Pararge aegeria TaxID=116150 RepID=UPI0019D165E1|nr:chaoptin isoform X2 [Pararge aegeria]